MSSTATLDRAFPLDDPTDVYGGPNDTPAEQGVPPLSPPEASWAVFYESRGRFLRLLARQAASESQAVQQMR